jgi:hypothetical protein
LQKQDRGVVAAFDQTECMFEPSNWFVTFHELSERRWVNWLSWGRYKHVSAFGYCAMAQCWVFVDVLASRMRVRLASDDLADRLIAAESASGMVLKMPPVDVDRKPLRLKPLLYCVPATAHLLGLPMGALRPDALFRQCLAHGGKPVSNDDDQVQHKNRSLGGAATASG